MSVMVRRASCSACGAPRTIVHTEWVGWGGRLETPRCRSCGRSWAGYEVVGEVDFEGCLVVWDEEVDDEKGRDVMEKPGLCETCVSREKRCGPWRLLKVGMLVDDSEGCSDWEVDVKWCVEVWGRLKELEGRSGG